MPNQELVNGQILITKWKYSVGQNNHNWFDQGGQEYAKFRPIYPQILGEFLGAAVKQNKLAVDIGCGNGQLTSLLTKHFAKVIGIDPSQSQIDNAAKYNNVEYICAPAEQLPQLNPVNLITVAQAAHWFDLPSFYTNAKKLAAKDGLLALICYGTVNPGDDLADVFTDFYKNQINTFWTFDRSLIDNGYANLDFPFKEIPTPVFKLEYDWDYQQFLGYISTWSAVKNALNSGHGDMLDNFANEFAKAWGNKSAKRTISWPIHIRMANINPS